ncbi:MAG: hypothetical protein R3Y67_00090 [Eubacteriales bacterium]
MKGKQLIHKIEWYLIPVILILYPMRKCNQGIDLSDTGYSLYNYELFQQAEVTWWLVATYLSNCLGSMLQKLPYGDTLLGMNCYTSLLISAMVLMIYCFLKQWIPFWLVFLGEIMAIHLCWCPTAILYNYLTYFFLTIGIILLYEAMRREKYYLYVLAGIVLGLNVMVRFSNLTHCTFILAVWYMGCLKKSSHGVIAKQTGSCVGGYILGMVTGLIPIAWNYGIEEYFNMFFGLSTVGESDGSYALMDMLTSTLVVYWNNLKWIAYMAIATCAGAIYFRVCGNKFKRVNQVLYCMGIIVLFRWFYGQGFYNINYQTYDSILRPTTIYIVLTVIASFVMMGSKKTTVNEKTGLCILVILTFLLPLGSNNYIYSVFNYTFFLMPVGLYFAYLAIRQTKWDFPVKAMLFFFLIGLAIQNCLFGLLFSFSGSNFGAPRDTMVTEIPKLAGMYTDDVRAQDLEQLYQVILEQGYLEEELITMGNLPALHYYFDMDAYLSSAWIDLDSYTMPTFEEDWLGKESQEDSRPVIITNTTIAQIIEAGSLETLTDLYRGYEKYLQIIDYMEEHQYELQLINNEFALYY